MSWLDETLSGIFGTDDKQTNTLIGLGGSLLLNQTGLGQAQIPQTGYQGSIPDYTIQRERVPRTYDPNRRPGSGGQRYFTQTQFVPTEDITPAEPMSAEGLAALNEANPARQERKPVTTMAKGGIAELEKGISKIKGAVKVLKELNYPDNIIDTTLEYLK